MQRIKTYKLFEAGGRRFESGPLALLISVLFGSMGLTAVVAMLASFAISAIALLVIAVARKLVYNVEHGA